MRRTSSPLVRYGIAVLAAVVGLAPLFIPLIGRGFGAALLFAVVLSAWFGGMGPGLVTTLLCGTAAAALMVAFNGRLEPWQFVSLTLFTVAGSLVSALVEALHAARRRAEATGQWLTTVLRSVGDAVIVTDAQGRVTYVNPVAAELTGWEPEPAAGEPLDTVFHILREDTRQPVESPVARVLREGVVVGLGNHTILVARDGTERPIDDSAAPIRSDAGQISGVVLVFRDVTDRRRTEAQRAELLAREQAARAAAETANQAKDHFLAVLSHELRTPLTPVLLDVSAQLEGGELPESLRPTLEMTRSNIELEARLIDDLLDLSKIVSGKLSLQLKVTEIHGLIDQVMRICRDEIESASLRVAMDLAAPASHVEADPARLQQVIWNLVKNAVKFTPAGGTLRVRTFNGETPGNGDGARSLVLEITDSGMGIDPELLPRIFDAFEQGTSLARGQRAEGLGLGLAISRSVIQAHGGRVSAHSDGAGHGATFRVELPAAATAPAPAEPAAVQPTRTPRERRLLVVEDDRSTLEVMARVLRRRGYTVTTADSFGTALETAAADRFDLVISDLGLADGSGFDLMRTLHAAYGLPGIALSGFGMTEDIQKSKDAGFYAHLTKPVDIQKLETLIEQGPA